MQIVITGGAGFIGSTLAPRLLSMGHKVHVVDNLMYGGQAILPLFINPNFSFSEVDVTDAAALAPELKDADVVVHLAAKVGGVKGNSDYVSDFFHDNIMINTNVLQACKNHGVSKVLSLLSTCIYPDNPTYPLTEDQIHNGEPHRSNFGYAYAKRMLEVHSRTIRSQYALNYITAVPNNIYGPKDNFDLENGHVIPSMIRKFHEAKINDTPVVLWGSGNPLREFTYSTDIAKALLFLLENYEGEIPINIGTTREVSIKKVSEIISKEIGFTAKVMWDITKPEGQLKKPSSNQKFLDMCPNFCYTDLECGLKDTISWFKNSYPNVRGIN